jgi:hypothetical protein
VFERTIINIDEKISMIFLGLNLSAYCQTIGVEKTFSIQTGLAGIWINNETKLSNSIALRSEIGIEHDFCWRPI